MILERLWSDRRASTLATPAAWLVEALAGDWTSEAGVTINETTALSISTVFACVRVIAETVGSLPLFVYRRLPNGGRAIESGHPMFPVLHDRPNRWSTSMAWREAMTMNVLLWGNSYARIDAVGQRVTDLWLWHPSRVQIGKTVTGDLIYTITTGDDGLTKEVVPANRMLHISGPSPDGVMGWSILKLAREAMGLHATAEKYASNLYGNQGTMRGILEHPGRMEEAASKQFRSDWERIYGGPKGKNRTVILQAGMTFKSISMPPEDAQMLENRQFSVEEICRWFNVPPHKVQHLLRATFSNIEHQQLSFSTDTIRPWLVRWEQELKRKLFVGDDEHYAEHVMDAMLRGDSVSRAESNMRQFSNGALTINEWRRMENRPSLDDPVGDMHFVPVNLMPAEKLTAAPAQPPAPPAPPPQRSIDEVIQRYRPILEQVVTSLGRLESDRMTRAAKRPEAENAIAAFRASHHDHAVAVLRTVTTLIATDMGRSDVDAILQEITTRHIARIKPGEIDGVAEASLIALDIVEYMNHASS